MKATLEFDMEDADDRQEHYRCINALNMAMAIYRITEMFRSSLKYGDLHEGQYKVVEGLASETMEILKNYNINLDNLID